MAGEAEAVEPQAELPEVVEAAPAPFIPAPEPFVQPGQGFYDGARAADAARRRAWAHWAIRLWRPPRAASAHCRAWMGRGASSAAGPDGP